MVNSERWNGAENSEGAKEGHIKIRFSNVMGVLEGTLEIMGYVPFSKVTGFLKDHGAEKGLLDTISQIGEDIRGFREKGVLIDTDGNIGEAAKASGRHSYNITPQDFSNLTYEIKGGSGRSLAFYMSGRLANGYIRAFEAYSKRLLDQQKMPDGYDVRAHTVLKPILVEIAKEGQLQAKQQQTEQIIRIIP